jgi:hypothetical protein
MSISSSDSTFSSTSSLTAALAPPAAGAYAAPEVRAFNYLNL